MGKGTVYCTFGGENLNFVLLFIVFIILYGIKCTGKEFNEAYLSKTSTTCINGIFVCLVFFSHFKQYIEFGPYDKFYRLVLNNIGQYMVVPFLFFSGYGIMSSVRKKGHSYIKSIPFYRLGKVWMHFALAVLVFYSVDILCQKRYNFSRLLLSMIGWESIGNSNWYIFCVLIMYMATFLAFSLTGKMQTQHKDTIGAGLVVLSCVCFVLLLRPFKDEYWFNTAIAYPLGMLYFLYEGKIRRFVQKNNIWYIAACIAVLLLFYVVYPYIGKFVIYEVSVILVMALILLITMKFSITNNILLWLGKYTFEIYILQRVPMMLFHDVVLNKYLYCGLCFIITLVIAVAFRRLTNKIDEFVYEQKFIKTSPKGEKSI